jgi:hypothetical protein
MVQLYVIEGKAYFHADSLEDALRKLSRLLSAWAEEHEAGADFEKYVALRLQSEPLFLPGSDFSVHNTKWELSQEAILKWVRAEQAHDVAAALTQTPPQEPTLPGFDISRQH